MIAVSALVLAVFGSLTGPWFAPLNAFSFVYIRLLHGLPSLLLVLIFGFGVPAQQIPGLPRSSLFCGAAAMISSHSAYAADVYRSGMDAVHDGQRAAAKTLGLSQWQTNEELSAWLSRFEPFRGELAPKSSSATWIAFPWRLGCVETRRGLLSQPISSVFCISSSPWERTYPGLHVRSKSVALSSPAPDPILRAHGLS